MAITNWDRHGPEMEKNGPQGLPHVQGVHDLRPEGWQADDRAIYNTLEGQRPGPCCWCTPNRAGFSTAIARHHHPDEMKAGRRLHAITRPNFIEAEAIQRAIMWSQ